MPLVSIIIRTKNEAAHLGEVLEMLKKQTFQDFEIIIVDSSSTDKTLKIAQEYQEKYFPSLKIIKIKPEEFTYPYASNIGAENSQGKYLLYLSGHSVPISKSWLENALKHFKNNQVAGVYCNPLYPLNDANLTERIIMFLSRLWRIKLRRWKKVETISQPRMGVMGTTNAIIRKDLWDQYHFNLDFAGGGEDGDWISYWMERGYVAIRDIKFTVRHSHGLDPVGYWRQYWHWRRDCAKPSPFKYRQHKFN